MGLRGRHVPRVGSRARSVDRSVLCAPVLAAVVMHVTRSKHGAGRVDEVPLEPLEGYTVGVTADRRASEQCRVAASSRRHGCSTRPTIATAYLGSDERLRRSTDAAWCAVPPDVLVITTGIGIRAWIEAAAELGTRPRAARRPRWRRGARRAGPKAAAAAEALGLEVWAHRTRRTHDGRPGELLGGRGEVDDTSAVQCFGDDSQRRRGVAGPAVDVRRDHGPGVPLAAARRPQTRAGAGARGCSTARVHAVTFTSAPAVRNLFAIADTQGTCATSCVTVMNGVIIAACVGPACADAARDGRASRRRSRRRSDGSG